MCDYNPPGTEREMVKGAAVPSTGRHRTSFPSDTRPSSSSRRPLTPFHPSSDPPRASCQGSPPSPAGALSLSHPTVPLPSTWPSLGCAQGSAGALPLNPPPLCPPLATDPDPTRQAKEVEDASTAMQVSQCSHRHHGTAITVRRRGLRGKPACGATYLSVTSMQPRYRRRLHVVLVGLLQ